MEIQNVAFNIAIVMFLVVVVLFLSRLRRDTTPKPPKSGGFINDNGKYEKWVD